ncbi:hypothetical protein ZWY2020_014733 [Hordeum vulgare]|nr:hypothetical protein ZWY2020_014733 [Hordeum vulgare]
MEWRAPAAALLRRRHAVSWEHEGYAHAREATLAGVGLTESGVNGWRRPFVTHFTGCHGHAANRTTRDSACEHVEPPLSRDQRRQSRNTSSAGSRTPSGEVGDDDGRCAAGERPR